jgi:hypothetical protein
LAGDVKMNGNKEEKVKNQEDVERDFLTLAKKAHDAKTAYHHSQYDLREFIMMNPDVLIRAGFVKVQPNWQVISKQYAPK